MNTISLQFAEYRQDPRELAERVDGYLAKADQDILEEDPFALVVPHAGYVYSGPVAAFAYKAIKGKTYDTVVIVGPSHHASFKGISVVDTERFDTPLGSLTMDKKLIEQLLGSSNGIQYLPQAHDQEHSVEVQLPFLQRSLKPFALVMAVMGGYSKEAEEAFVSTLAKAINGKKILLIASSDLSHYHEYHAAKKLDQAAIALIQDLDPDALLQSIRQRTCELCGVLPVRLAMELSLELGHRDVRLLHIASSGDTAGSRDQVVGYASLAFMPGKIQNGASGRGLLGPDEKKRLLKIARENIAACVNKKKVPVIKEDSPSLNARLGAFVTIKTHDQLRGCIGNFRAEEPLYMNIISMAVSAATRDPRFPPMTPSELDDMDLEISVLSPLTKTENIEEIEVGRHGIYIIKGYHSGVLLPQVATEYGWDRITFLEQTCRKAGLPKNAWKEGAEILLFEAQVFGEQDRR